MLAGIRSIDWCLLGMAKSHAPPAFCAKWLCRTAQNPVTGLWTACTRLKINQIEARSFY
jgi:hypothetical protein